MPNKEQLEVQANAAHGFSVWLTSTLPQQADEQREFSDHLLHVLDVYGRELERLIDGDLATQDWYQLITTTTILARMLQDELLEVNPELAEYRPSDEPTTIEEMMSRLLFDAVVLFEASQREMGTLLEKPAIPDALNEFIQRVI